jgi:Ca2+-binding RTX toxin-like protein
LQVDSDNRPILSSNRTYKVDANDYIKMNGLSLSVAQGMRSMNDFIPIERRLRHVQAIREIYNMNSVLQRHGYVPPIQLDPGGARHVFGRLASGAGVVGDLASASMMFAKASSEMRTGNHQEAHNTVASWTFETVGSFAAARVATVVVAPLMVAGPIGFLLGAGIIIGASIIGGELGKKLLNKAKQKLIIRYDEIMWLASPLVLDLDGNGIQTLALNQTYIHFDHDNNDFFEQTGWVGANDGLLILDLNGNGYVDSGAELFGNHTRLDDGQLAADGFTALAMYDSNADQQIDHLDSIWTRLRVWRDQNSNAQTEPGEWLSMADLQVKALHLGYLIHDVVDVNGNTHRQHGTYERLDGQVAALTDVWFEKNTIDSLPPAIREVDEQTAALPNLPGMGIVPSLHQALMNPNNPSLRQTLLQWLGSTRLQRMTLNQQLLFQWCDASDNPLTHPDRIYSSDDNLIHLKVAVIEKLFGDRLINSEIMLGTNRSAAASALCDEMAFYMDMLLNVEVAIQPLFELAVPVESDQFGPLQLDLTDSVKHLRSQFQQDPDPGFIPMIHWQLIHHDSAGQSFFHALQSIAASTPDALHRAMRLQKPTAAPWEWRRGSPDNDQLIGTALNDFIEAGGSLDTMWGNDGDDTLHGGPGRDVYYGGKGGDTYYISQNADGEADTILDEGSDVYGLPDRVFFWDLASHEVHPVLEGQKVVFYSRKGGLKESPSWEHNGVALIHNQLDPRNRIEEFHFADDVVWSYNTLLLKLPLKGTEGNDTLTGVSNTSNRLHGLGGNDTLIGGMLNDHLEGHTGRDRLTGLVGADTLIGGPGDDTLEGGEGADTYYFSANSGHDRISDLERRSSGADRIIFTDLSTTSLTGVARTRQSLRLHFGSSSSLLLVNQLDPQSRIERFVFANGPVWDHDTLMRQLL